MAGLDPPDVDHLLPVAQEQPDGVPGLLQHSVGPGVEWLQGRTLPLGTQEHVTQARWNV